jgi:hypothetical protein
MNADPKQENTEDLAEQLAQANERIAQISQEAGDLKLDRQLLQKLAAVGTLDLEAALLLAKARLDEHGDIDRAIESLKTEKRYLFQGGGDAKPAARKTAGSRERVGSKSTLLEQAAKKAARTGSRADLLEYLRLRRSAS